MPDSRAASQGAPGGVLAANDASQCRGQVTWRGNLQTDRTAGAAQFTPCSLIGVLHVLGRLRRCVETSELQSGQDWEIDGVELAVAAATGVTAISVL